MDSTRTPSLLYLWDKRTLYIGPLFEPIHVSQGAASLIVSLNGAIKCSASDKEDEISCSSILLPPGTDFHANTGDRIVANCMLDPIGFDFALLAPRMQHKQASFFYEIQEEENYAKCFKSIYQSNYASKEAYEKLDRIICPSESIETSTYTIDSRIERVIELIKHNFDENLSIESMAEQVNLSVSRLVQLFKKQTGVPIRRYRLWHRLYRTVVLTSETDNLTTAAIAAGFSDASHLNHTFRSMLGVKPSLILGQPNKIRIITSENEVRPVTTRNESE